METAMKTETVMDPVMDLAMAPAIETARMTNETRRMWRHPQPLLPRFPRRSRLSMRRVGREGVGLIVLLGSLGSVACGDLTGDALLPPGTQSPTAYNSPQGALGMYRGVKGKFVRAVQDYLAASGALTDELTGASLGQTFGTVGGEGDVTDERILSEQQSSDGAHSEVYNTLQEVRGSAALALGLLQTYAPAQSPALRGEMYALQGYAELLLAELYCSGVPLSTLDFQKDFTYKPGSRQEDVYAHAMTLFDSALALANDSVSVMALARVGKGRALLNLGRYTEAGQAVAAVSDASQYGVANPWKGVGDARNQLYAYNVATSEGGNGLPFSAGTDPRVEVTPIGPNKFGVPQFTPNKYPSGSMAPVILASGLEARLIEAEAALHNTPNDPQWLTLLNGLRTSCTDVGTCPTPAPAGTGGIGNLPLLTDPGDSAARVTLLFMERAYWLFLTGHRQGDLRRLIREYGRLQAAVYPTGSYFGGLGFYGSDVNLPIPADERTNTLFTGCLDRGA